MQTQTLEEQLHHLPTPTATHVPVSHGCVQSVVRNAIFQAGAGAITDSFVETSHDGNRAVGTFLLTPTPGAPFTTTIGWINSHDKSSSIRLLFGSHVFVCTNGCVVGEKILARKHTSRIHEDIIQRADAAVSENIGLLIAEQRRIEHYRSTMLSSNQVSHALVSAVDAGAIPAGEILKVREEYHNPTFEAHHDNGGDGFRLLNAFTERQKQYTPQSRIKRSQLLMPVLDAIMA